MDDQERGNSIFPESGMSLSAKAQAFHRLATARLRKIDTALRVLGNLANPANYEFQPGDVEFLFMELHNKVAGIKEQFDKALNRRRRGS